VSPSFGGFVPFGAFAVAVTMSTPVLFLPFLLTFTGRFTSCRAPHCGPESRPGAFRVKVAGCDLTWRLCSWLGGAQPERYCQKVWIGFPEAGLGDPPTGGT
jgi:hypothetical protein